MRIGPMGLCARNQRQNSDSLTGRHGARFEDRPVEGLEIILVSRKSALEVERELRGPVLLQMGQPLLGFVNARYIASRNPPESQVRAAELLEPVVPLLE